MRFSRFLPAIGLLAASVVPLYAEKPAEEIETARVRLETTRAKPKVYGTQDYSVTTVSAMEFFPASSSESYSTSGEYGRRGPLNTRMQFYAQLQVPDGVVIDYVGLNSKTDAPDAVGVALTQRASNALIGTHVAFSSTVHDWDTDYNAAPLGNRWRNIPGYSLVLLVEQGVFATPQYFGSVEVWWRREVSPPPGAPTFGDVPTQHPFFQFIEALAASGITAGCGGGDFCPEEPLTRGQMAVFLAKALGLHTPGTVDPPQPPASIDRP
jgi:hypothetical protein